MSYKNIILNDNNAVYQQAAKQSHFYKGFSTVIAGTSTKIYDFELIKQDIINHFKTRKGERVMNPNFGSIIWDLLMEPFTDRVRELLVQDITRICNFDPRATPTQIDLTEYSNGYVVELTLLLNATNESSNLKLSFDQTIGLQVQ